MPVTQAGPNYTTYLTIMLRTPLKAEAIAGSLRNSVAGLDPDLPVSQISTARHTVDQGLGGISLLGSLLGAFATIGLILAAIGIYGVVSYMVVQRVGELGIRMALGAQTRDVLWLVLRKGAVLVGIGALLGVFGAYGVSKVLASLIPSLPTRDPLMPLFAALALTAVALVACYIPARRATRVDPLMALKSE
jgi:ABC-type antimicrobial peptide transport system permease subunit